MSNPSPHQLLSVSWLDDQTGPAKLTPRQLELLTELEQNPATKQQYASEDNITQEPQTAAVRTLADSLKPHWEPNEILSLFYEERETVIRRGDECQQLAANVDSVLKDILALKDLYHYVSLKTSQLHSECKNITQEISNLRESYERISNILVKQEELQSILRRMPDIKNQILQTLNQVSQRYQVEQTQPTTDSTPLDEYYGRFFIECRRMKELTGQLESCLSSSYTQELLLHLEEIYTLYSDIREQLIEPVFTKSIRALISKSDRNYCDLFRQTCSILIRTLRNEVQLFNQLFPSIQNNPTKPSGDGESTKPPPPPLPPSRPQQNIPIKGQAIDGFLGLLCKIFYEHMRPVVIHVNHLETLTTLYKLITETMRPELAEVDSFRSTMSALSEDIQERMVFRAEVFIQESVLDYKPSGGDLAYPEKLEIVSGGELKNYQSMWYPTVQRTVLALFYLNRVFDSMTFRELAQEVVLACFKSLDIAQKLIDARHGGTKIEASLFLSKHLAIISDQLLGYGIESIQFPIRQDPQSQQNMFELNTSDLESMLRLFQQEEPLVNAALSESIWSQLNETIVSGTRWTLKATRIKQ